LIELGMVRRMAIRALFLSPVVVAAVAAFALVRGEDALAWALSAAIGLALTLGNLWLSARIIGGVAEKDPNLLLPAAMISFTLGLAILTGVAFLLKATGFVFFPVTGFTLVGAHLVLVLWEAARAYPVAKIDQSKTNDTTLSDAHARART
jgi:hypothetical protein